MKMTKAKILVVDDEPLVLDSCRRVLAESGHDVDTASGGEEALARLESKRYDLMLVDLKMPDMDGLEVLHKVRAADPSMVVAIITGYGTVETAVEAMRNGAYDYVSKPISASSLEMLAKRALETARLQKELARMEKEKENFIRTIYHEFKSPIADITMFLNILGKTLPLDEKQRKNLSLCEKKLTPLKELTEDLLQITKAEFMQRQKKIAPCDILELAKQAVSSISTADRASGISVQIDPASESIFAVTEREGITTVINNLVRNAIRYNKPGGSVKVKVYKAGGNACIDIADTGIGIAKENCALIFDEFFRVRDESTKDISGTGLGLSIVKRILDSLGSRIKLESNPGVGSTFTIHLPLQPAS